MTLVLGLTGSIGMGKSTTARMFADEGVPVWDADAVVHRLYAPGGAAVQAVKAIFPDVIEDGAVSREGLKAKIAADPTVLDRLQDAVHPLVAADRVAFLKNADAPVVLLDIPLLFETGADALCDKVVVVTVPKDIQKERVMARGEMTEADFQMILSRQMPDAEKRERADFVIETLTLEAARAGVRKILQQLGAADA